jgi:AAA+ ATPase superfamily predicted ATPase
MKKNEIQAECPFFTDGCIQHPELFVGRNYEISFIVHRMADTKPLSINIYGPRLMGKSSLLYHYSLTWESHIKPDARHKFAVIYVSLAQTKSKNDFYLELAKAWRTLPQRKKDVEWKQIWNEFTWTRKSFNEALKKCNELKLLPVVCLDDMEKLLKYPNEFDEDFFDNLNEQMNAGRLMLVIATSEALSSYKQDFHFKSTFFDLAQVLELQKLDSNDVDSFVLKAENASFDKKKLKQLRKWGSRHPYLLQLAGSCLWEDKDEDIARAQFEKSKQQHLHTAEADNSESKTEHGFLKPFHGFGDPGKWFAKK